jgi:protein-S-isoprenylcysteine O-methyltransferase Ste14
MGVSYSLPKRALLVVVYLAALFGILFGCAGRFDLPFFWAWIAVLLAVWIVAAGCMDPDLMKERMRPGAGGIDRRLRFVAMPFGIAHLAIAGLDVGRFHWSDTVPHTLQLTALIAFAASYAFSAWAIIVNRFFSPVVRVQSERGHQVISSGPYAWVRHPGYAGLLVNIVASGLVLGSWWSLAPMAVLFALILRRAIIEDHFLQQHLGGYTGYARRVRFRLFPGVW